MESWDDYAFTVHRNRSKNKPRLDVYSKKKKREKKIRVWEHMGDTIIKAAVEKVQRGQRTRCKDVRGLRSSARNELESFQSCPVRHHEILFSHISQSTIRWKCAFFLTCVCVLFFFLRYFIEFHSFFLNRSVFWNKITCFWWLRSIRSNLEWIKILLTSRTVHLDADSPKSDSGLWDKNSLLSLC